MTEQQLAAAMRDYLVKGGFECGQRFAELGGVVREIQSKNPTEEISALRTKAQQVILNKSYGFKSRAGRFDTEVSASSSSSSECGN